MLLPFCSVSDIFASGGSLLTRLYVGTMLFASMDAIILLYHPATAARLIVLPRTWGGAMVLAVTFLRWRCACVSRRRIALQVRRTEKKHQPNTLLFAGESLLGRLLRLSPLLRGGRTAGFGVVVGGLDAFVVGSPDDGCFFSRPAGVANSPLSNVLSYRWATAAHGVFVVRISLPSPHCGRRRTLVVAQFSPWRHWRDACPAAASRWWRHSRRSPPVHIFFRAAGLTLSNRLLSLITSSLPARWFRDGVRQHQDFPYHTRVDIGRYLYVLLAKC